jgi:dipeptidase E
LSAGQIVAIGGVDVVSDTGRHICDYPLSLCGKPEPRIGVLSTPSGDNPAWDEPFRKLFSRPCEFEYFTFFREPLSDFTRLRDCDIVFVPGGNTVAALAVWRAYGVHDILREVWQAGGILTGWSAGALCWFAAGLTDSLAPGELRPYGDALGFLPDSMCPHFDDDDRRRVYGEHVAAGTLPDGLGVDESAAAHFVGAELVAVVTTQAGNAAHRVVRRGEVAAVETIDTRPF